MALSLAIGKSYQKLAELQQALRYFELASSLDKTKLARTKIDENIRNVRAAIRRNANNEQRMPVIHNELEQEHVVRPRQAAAVPKPQVPVRNTNGGSPQ